MDFLAKLFNAEQIGGWVRAAVAAGLAALALKYPLLGGFVTPAVGEAIQVILVAVAVGVWSSIAKKVAA